MGQGALSKPAVQWWLSLNSSTRGRCPRRSLTLLLGWARGLGFPELHRSRVLGVSRRRFFESGGRPVALFVCACWNGSFVEGRLTCHVTLPSSFSIGV